jgi:hypothetical protein
MLGPYDVVLGRSSSCFNNIGNRRFRVSISLNLQEYEKSQTRSERTSFIYKLSKLLREQVGYRFLKRQDEHYYILATDTEARKKIGHALRDQFVAFRKHTHHQTWAELDVFDATIISNSSHSSLLDDSLNDFTTPIRTTSSSIATATATATATSNHDDHRHHSFLEDSSSSLLLDYDDHGIHVDEMTPPLYAALPENPLLLHTITPEPILDILMTNINDPEDDNDDDVFMDSLTNNVPSPTATRSANI